MKMIILACYMFLFHVECDNSKHVTAGSTAVKAGGQIRLTTT